MNSLNVWILLLFQFICCINGYYHYDYSGDNGPPHWGKISLECKYPKQSPINIDATKTAKSKLRFINTCFNQTQLVDRSSVIHIDQHTVRIEFDETSHVSGWNIPYVTLGFFLYIELFVLHSITFHWGEDNFTGSEHAINGTSSPLEMQIYFRAQKYKNWNEAKNYMAGVLVLSVLVDVTPDSGHKFFDFIKNIDTSYGVRTSHDFRGLPFSDIIPMDGGMYHYVGSLTAPPCSPHVYWFVLNERLQISSENLERFRSIKSSNHRPIQPKSGRIVYAKFDQVEVEICTDSTIHAKLLSSPRLLSLKGQILF